MSAAEFLAEAHRRLTDRYGTPIIYLHADEDSEAFGVLLTAEAYRQILELVPEGEEITNIVMAHDHLEGNAEEPSTAEADKPKLVLAGSGELPGLVLSEDPLRVTYCDARTADWLQDRLDIWPVVADCLDGISDALEGMLSTDTIPPYMHEATRVRIDNIRALTTRMRRA